MNSRSHTPARMPRTRKHLSEKDKIRVDCESIPPSIKDSFTLNRFCVFL